MNGKYAGKCLFDDQVDISAYAFAGDNDIEVSFILSKRNLLGPYHWSQKCSHDMISSDLLDYSELWRNGHTEYYTDNYELLMLDCRE